MCNLHTVIKNLHRITFGSLSNKFTSSFKGVGSLYQMGLWAMCMGTIVCEKHAI